LSPDRKSTCDPYINKEGTGVKRTANLVPHWRICKEFLDRDYPDVEIASINPVRLRGLFTDIFHSDEYKFERVELTHAEDILAIRNNKLTRKYLHTSNKFHVSEFLSWFKKDDPEWYMIIWNNIPVGYIRTKMEDNIPYVGIDIHPDFRRRGHAETGYKEIFSIFKNRGHKEVRLVVLEDNISAIKLYLKLDFYETERKNVKGKPSIIMRKKL
jgi:ribosomal protein S18 acetylase RimI-like enzyme